MKNLFFFLLASTAVILTACNSGKQDPRLHGTWKITPFVDGKKMETPTESTFWMFGADGRYSGFTTFSESSDTVHFENTYWRHKEGTENQIEVQATPTKAFTADYSFNGEVLVLNVIDDPRDPIGLSYELEKVGK